VRIVLDVRYRTRSGAVSYLANLTPALLAAAGRQHEFVLLRSSGQGPLPAVVCESVELPPWPGGIQAVHDQVALPRLLRRLGADLYHPMKYLGSMRPPCPQVTTVHAITEDFGGTFPSSPAEVLYWKFMGRRMLRASSHLVAVSGFIRQFLLERIGVPAEKITVVPNGIDPRFGPPGPGTGAAEDAGHPYILSVGNVFPVKNHLTSLAAFQAIAGDDPSLRWKVAGSTRHAFAEEVRAAVAGAGLAHRVDFLGYVEVPELIRLMHGARFLLMPSLTEGCPVTLLEAMACGTPVIASGRGGIPETAAGAALMVEDPMDLVAWGRAARTLHHSEAERDRFRAAGLERARAFTWERTAASTLAVYHQVGAAP
jgi:glycosyltransferase involved in cell wall biosynthesis